MARGNLSIINNVQKHRAGIASANDKSRLDSYKELKKKHEKVLVYLKKLDGLYLAVKAVREKLKCLA